jgi:hypothetical protein
MDIIEVVKAEFVKSPNGIQTTRHIKSVCRTLGFKPIEALTALKTLYDMGIIVKLGVGFRLTGGCEQQ